MRYSWSVATAPATTVTTTAAGVTSAVTAAAVAPVEPSTHGALATRGSAAPLPARAPVPSHQGNQPGDQPGHHDQQHHHVRTLCEEHSEYIGVEQSVAEVAQWRRAVGEA